MGADLQHIFPYVLFPLASLLTCISLVFLIAGSRDVREDFRLLAVSCIALLLWGVAEVSSHILPYPRIVAWLSYLLPVSFIILPMMIHLTHLVLGIQRRAPLVWIAYVLVSLTIGITWLGKETFPQVNLIAALLAFTGAAYSIFCFMHARKHEKETPRIIPRLCVASGHTPDPSVPGDRFPRRSSLSLVKPLLRARHSDLNRPGNGFGS